MMPPIFLGYLLLLVIGGLCIMRWPIARLPVALVSLAVAGVFFERTWRVWMFLHNPALTPEQGIPSVVNLVTNTIGVCIHLMIFAALVLEFSVARQRARRRQKRHEVEDSVNKNEGVE